MQQVLLFHHSAQAAIAQQLKVVLADADAQVVAIATDLKAPAELHSAVFENSSQRIIWLLSDNLLKNMASAVLLVEISQVAGMSGRSYHILTNGVERSSTGDMVEVPTRINRVSHVIHYMNHWQELYLDLRRQANKNTAGGEAQQDNIKTVRSIYQNIGDVLRQIKEKEALDLSEIRQLGYQPLFTWLGAGKASVQVSAPHIENTSVILEDQSVPQASGYSSHMLPSFTDDEPAADTLQPPTEQPPATKFVTITGNVMNIEDLLNTGLPQSEKQDTEVEQEPEPVVPELPAPFVIEPVSEPFFDEVALPELTAEPAATVENTVEQQLPVVTEAIQEVETTHLPTQQVVDVNTPGGLDPELEALFSQNKPLQNVPINSLIDPTEASTEASSPNKQQEKMPVDDNNSTPMPVLTPVPVGPIIRVTNQVEVGAKPAIESSELEVTQLGSPAETQPSFSPQERLQKAVSEADQGQSDTSIEILGALIADHPDFLLARLTLAGIQAEQLHDHVAACRTLEGLLLLDPRQEDALFLMGQYCTFTGEVWRSKLYWERLAELNPNYKNIHEHIADLLAQHYKGQTTRTDNYYLKAMAHNAGNLPLLSKYATFLTVQSRNYDAAAVQWLKVLEIEPENENARLQLTNLKDLGVDVKIPALPNSQPEVAKPRNDNGQVVFITGASSGIGRATAEMFAQHGYRVVLAGRRTELLELAQAALTEAHHNYNTILTLDVRTPDAIKEALLNLPAEFADIDILINNAGLAKGLSPIHEGSFDHWDQMIDTNIKGLLYVTRLVAPAMVARRKGHIINIGSTAGKEVYPSGNVYCATKFAVDALTKAMRQDLFTHGIRVSQVSPGHVEGTEFAVVRFDGDTDRANIYEHFKPLHAEDVARVIYFVITQPPHVNIQDVLLMSTQQAGAQLIDRSGR